MAEEDEGAIGADWAMGSERAMGAEGAVEDEVTEGFEGAEEDEGAAIYIVRWLRHHGNRLYG